MGPAIHAAADGRVLSDARHVGNGSTMKTPGEPRLGRYLKSQAAMLAYAKLIVPSPVLLPDSVVNAIGSEKAAALADGTLRTREWQAIHNRDEVERMSIAGTPVAQIASALSLSYSHVVALRARLGVGRQR